LVWSVAVTWPLAVTGGRVSDPPPVTEALVGAPAYGPPVPPPLTTHDGAPEMVRTAPAGSTDPKALTSVVAEKLTAKLWPLARVPGTVLVTVQVSGV
jgi:hypothetical protein